MKILPFLVLFFISFSSYSQSKDNEVEYFLHVMKNLLIENKNIEHYTDTIEIEPRNVKELGFDAYQYNYWIYRNKISYNFDIFTFNKKIVKIKVILTNDEVSSIDSIAQNNKQVSELINKYWIRKSYYNSYTKQNEEQLEYEFFDEKLYSDFKNTATKYLGKQEQIIIPKNQEQNYDLLISPFTNGVFGEGCGDIALAPQSRIAISEIKENNPELLRNIIKGFSPTGRVYAIEALLELAKEEKIKLLESDEELIEKVLDIYILIKRCNGCIFSSVMVTELFRESKYRSLLLDNKILMLRQR